MRSLVFSTDLTKSIVASLSITNDQMKCAQISMCLVHLDTSLLLANQIAATLSTLILIGNGTSTPMHINS